MDEETVQQCVSVLVCRREGFRQTHLGLPLSTIKLRLSAFSVQIAKADKYLAGLQTALLDHMGRATLVNSVIDSQLIYAMRAANSTWSPRADRPKTPLIPLGGNRFIDRG
jgi:hypothetical protein